MTVTVIGFRDEFGVATPFFVGLAMTSPGIGIRDGSQNEADKVDGHCEELATKQSPDSSLNLDNIEPPNWGVWGVAFYGVTISVLILLT
jgi:hypothetical protein